MKSLLALVVLSLSTSAWAGKVNLSQDIASLGSDQAVLKRAQKLDPNNQVSVVQKRAVDRHSRFELSVDGGLLGGGDSYLNSQMLGGSLGFHFSPQFSMAVRYQSYVNSLTSEGKSVFDSAKMTGSQYVGGGVRPPAVDNPYDTTMLVVNWYPVYGKMNIGGWIPHFDVYLLAGYGKTNTGHRAFDNREYTTNSDTFTGGGGVGVWLTNFLAMRLEGRYQTYNDRPYAEFDPKDSRRIDNFIGQMSLGILL